MKNYHSGRSEESVNKESFEIFNDEFTKLLTSIKIRNCFQI